MRSSAAVAEACMRCVTVPDFSLCRLSPPQRARGFTPRSGAWIGANWIACRTCVQCLRLLSHLMTTSQTALPWSRHAIPSQHSEAHQIIARSIFRACMRPGSQLHSPHKSQHLRSTSHTCRMKWSTGALNLRPEPICLVGLGGVSTSCRLRGQHPALDSQRTSGLKCVRREWEWGLFP
jgi:hypothetical protein